jgi:hypothetical protein
MRGVNGPATQFLQEIVVGATYGGEYMQNLHLQIHPIFIPMTSRVII